MGGPRLSVEQRNNIFRMYKKGYQKEVIHEVLFNSDESLLTLKYLMDRLYFFENGVLDDILKYLSGTNSKGGRPVMLCPFDDLLIQNIIDKKNTMRLWAILEQFL